MTDVSEQIIECKTSAEKYLSYLQTQEDYPSYPPPEVVIICYQKSTLKSILEGKNYEQGESFLSKLYMLENRKVAVIGGFGCGAPALAIKIEELIVWGVKKFISVGTAGALIKEFSIGDITLGKQALCGEDGVSHLYAKSSLFASADLELSQKWEEFFKNKNMSLSYVNAWSFSNPYKETEQDIFRVTSLGCHVVDMEAATFYAIAVEKKVQALALFVISDCLYGEDWAPNFENPLLKMNLNRLADLAVEFSESL